MLRDVSVDRRPYGLPEAAALLVTVGLYIWRRNGVLGILAGTAVYVLLVNAVPFFGFLRAEHAFPVRPTDVSRGTLPPMTQTPRNDVRLFSYGTLQQRDVQLATFGRELAGWADALPGYVRSTVAITDPAVIALSGSTLHPIVTPTGDLDSVDGTVLDITRDELGAADEYEVANYVRIETTLASGTTAWVYLDGRTITTPV